MTNIVSLRAFKAIRALTSTQGQRGAKQAVEALEDASSNMLRFALMQRLAPAHPQNTLRFLRDHQYIERDRCTACGKPTRRGHRVYWENKERRVYACNKQCAHRALRGLGVK